MAGGTFMSKLIFGCGYLGLRVARRWRAAGETAVHVVTRSPERAATLAAEGLVPLVADVTRPETLRDLPAADTVLFAVGYDRASGKSIEQVYVAGFKHALDALPPAIGRLIYVSTTGVYGDCEGEWVNEDSACRPLRPGGQASLAAEDALWQSPLASRGVILRMAGLYGPGRIPNRAPLLAGEPLAVPTAGFLNLIHVDDAAAVVLAAEAADVSLPRRYVVSDGHPIPRGQYYAELARLLHAPAPRFVEPAADDSRAARAAADKRLDNSRMLAELHVSLAYPSYREGLAAIVAAEEGV